MADSVLKPFYDRASQAEERLSKLELAINTKKDVKIDGDKEKIISNLKAKLKEKETTHEAERKEAAMEIKKLKIEKEKLEYRIIHLIRAVREEEGKCNSVSDS
ncbi:hypothetical protein ACHQM5_012447 [Ranunculus cassubicifolius]